MAFVYARYKTVKKLVRDSAAVDIQRLYRGHSARSGRRPAGRVRVSHVTSDASGAPLSTELRAALQGKRKSMSPAQSFDGEELSSSLSASSLVHAKLSKLDAEFADTANEGPAAGTGGLEAMREEYKNVLMRKQDLKKHLKAFDDEFYARHGRAPKKAEKEVFDILKCLASLHF